MKRLVGVLAAVTLSACGLIKMNVNGKVVTLGAPDPAAAAPAAAARGPAASGQAPAAAPAAAPVQALANREVQGVAIPAAINETPLVVQAPGVLMDTSFSKKISRNNSPDCGSSMPSQPVATFDLAQPMPKAFQVSVVGGGNDGFVLMKQGTFWSTCTNYAGQVPVMAGPTEGWQAGHYEVYPLARYGGKEARTYQVEFSNPEVPQPWSPAVQKLSIGAKLEKPMFVQVTTRAGRVKLREEYQGRGCKVPLPVEPDLAIELTRPIPGLTVRPLLAAKPIALRVQLPRDEKHKGRKFCSSWNRTVAANNYSPTYESQDEYHFGRDDEGTFGFSLATAEADEAMTVTLMIFDASTQWTALAGTPVAGPVEMQDRELYRHYPQLDVKTLGINNYESARLTAELFAQAPRELFIYSKMDLDKDIARINTSVTDGQAFPAKNEPLLVVGWGKERVTVLAADGLRYDLKNTHVVPAPEGSAAALKAPRALKQDLPFEMVLHLTPPKAKSIYEAYSARGKKHEDCSDRVWKPFGKQLDGATWTVRNGSGSTTRVESPRAKQIRENGERAIDKACGSDDVRRKDKENTRLKLLTEVEKERAKLLASTRK